MRQSWYIQPKKSRDWTRFGSLKGYILASHSGQKGPRDKEGRDREGLGNSSCNSHPFQSWVANFFENTLERGKIIRDSTCNKEWQNMLATFARSLYRAFGPGWTHCPLPPQFLFLTEAKQSTLNDFLLLNYQGLKSCSPNFPHGEAKRKQ